MTWDHIATAIVGGVPTLVLAVAALLLVRFVPALRRRRARWAVAGVVVVAGVALFAWAARHNMGAPTSEYPALYDAFELAPPERQAAMSVVLREAAPRREIFSFSRDQRDRFVAAGGYCVEPGRSNCRPLPRGTLSEGEAVNEFPNIRSRTR